MAVNSGGAIVAGGIAIPAVVTLLSPAIKDEEEEIWKRVGALESFPPDTTKAALVQIERNDWAQSHPIALRASHARRGSGGLFPQLHGLELPGGVASGEQDLSLSLPWRDFQSRR